MCTEAASCDVTTDDLRGCLKEIERAVKIVSSTGHDYSAPIVPDTDDIEDAMPGTSGTDHVDASEFIKLKGMTMNRTRFISYADTRQW